MMQDIGNYKQIISKLTQNTHVTHSEVSAVKKRVMSKLQRPQKGHDVLFTSEPEVLESHPSKRLLFSIGRINLKTSSFISSLSEDCVTALTWPIYDTPELPTED